MKKLIFLLPIMFIFSSCNVITDLMERNSTTTTNSTNIWFTNNATDTELSTISNAYIRMDTSTGLIGSFMYYKDTEDLTMYYTRTFNYSDGNVTGIFYSYHKAETVNSSKLYFDCTLTEGADGYYILNVTRSGGDDRTYYVKVSPNYLYMKRVTE